MSLPTHSNPQILNLFLSDSYECSYLPRKKARSQLVLPTDHISNDNYTQLVQQGFRRSGNIVYRPHCHPCHACLSCRVNCLDFKANKTQRRIWKRHQNLRLHILEPCYREYHFLLYQKYLAQRHPGGEMTNHTKEDYINFLLKGPVSSKLLEFNDEQNKTRIVSIIDLLQDGLSAVYTFFDPDYPGSLGTYAILSQISLCQSLGLPWLYLGYWIEQSYTMSYKKNFRPLQYFKAGHWIDYNIKNTKSTQ